MKYEERNILKGPSFTEGEAEFEETKDVEEQFEQTSQGQWHSGIECKASNARSPARVVPILGLWLMLGQATVAHWCRLWQPGPRSTGRTEGKFRWTPGRMDSFQLLPAFSLPQKPGYMMTGCSAFRSSVESPRNRISAVLPRSLWRARGSFRHRQILRRFKVSTFRLF